MKREQDKKHARRVRNLIIVFVLTAIIISISTYAWFIGMRTVNVSSFDVEIASTESLLLSLDGEHWDTTVTINAGNFNDPTVVYSNNTNTWGGTKGLIPVSSIGEMDDVTSRLKLYEKTSLTATKGGYRIISDPVENSGATEAPGYVAFDLFIKNFSGAQYIADYNPLDEEAIYLTIDSEATVSENGTAGTGIENSVRVAFAQIGRVIATTDTAADITNITCETQGIVTGICDQRQAQIWEPNDTSHEANAIRWYEKSCRTRSGASVVADGAYDTLENCGRVIDGVAYPTYAIAKAITSGDHVDVYDGAEFNGYTDNTDDELYSYDYFTDTMKLLTSTSRPEIFTLAGNSITKVRIYVWIEGQDIDNYDFASIGKAIAVKFGFTKERFTEDDIEYNGPDLNQGLGPIGDNQSKDFTPPVIKLSGANPQTIPLNQPYNELGVESVVDNVNTILPAAVDISGTVNTSVAGTYKKVYKVTDEAGNVGIKVRTVIVEQQ